MTVKANGKRNSCKPPFNKLIGKDVIVAHQLLKNEIEQHEYWLVTNDLLQDRSPEGIKNWMTWDHSTKKTETGEIPFEYTQLTPLKKEISSEPPGDLGIKQKKRIIKIFLILKMIQNNSYMRPFV